jgi:LPS export ABC transporter protein LptC
MIFCAQMWYDSAMMIRTGTWRLIALGLLLAACSGVQGPSAEGYESLPADQVVVGLVQYIETNGVRSAMLRADTAYVFSDSAKAHLRGVNLVMYDENGAERTTLRSERGVIEEHTQAMVARGSVVLISLEDDRRIETEEFHYDPGRDRIWTDLPFVQIHRGSRTTGTSFESDTEFRNFRARGVTGRIEGLRIDY